MRLGLQLGYDDPVFWTGLAEEADALGFHSVWTSEAYGSDAISPLAWIGGRTQRIRLGTGIAQMPARSPATTAATAATTTLDHLSGGRLLLGLGTSGPQVAEGWHGQAWGKPLARTREYVSIVRAILRREEPLEHHGAHYDIPYSGADASGLGKPLKIIVRPLRREIPIYLAAIGPRNVALYVGGMGARGQNFYARLAARYGFEAEAVRIQDLFLEGKASEAAGAVPDALIDQVALVGDRARIADRLAAFEACGATTLILQTRQPEALRLLAELAT